MTLLKIPILTAMALMGILCTAPFAFTEEASPGLSLEVLLEEVQKANPDIEAARQKWEAAKQEIPQARSLEDPELMITQWSIPSNFNIGDADETWYGIGQAFPFPGKLSLRGQIATREAAAAEQAYRAKVREVAAWVKRAYYQLFLIQKSIDIHLEHEALLKDFIEIAEKKYALGLVAQQDVLKAQVELSKLHNSLLVLEQEKASAQAEINRLLNQPPNEPLGKPEELTSKPFSLTLEALTEQALKQRPELMTAGLMIEKSEKAIALARKNYLPDFMVELQYWNVHDGSNQWMAVGKINLPWIFKAKYDARLHQVVAEESQARSDYTTIRNQILFELKDLFVKVKTAEELIGVYQNGVLPQAEQSLEAARIGYQAGKVDSLNLIDSERNLRDFQLEYYSTLAQFWQHVAELERAVGVEINI